MRTFTSACALLAGLGAIVLPAAPAPAQGSYSSYDESAASALSRYVRELAGDPSDFAALIGAGRAALEVGDPQAAAGFFARADAVNPQSPLPQLGMGAVQVASGDARAAMPYFARAQKLGASAAMFGCERGLAYDLMGQQALAQADYRAALGGPDGDEARRRLALSLAISGDRAGAIATLAPLSAKGDSTSPRIRAFVLALGGDANAAMSAINAAMPGSSPSVAPFLQRLPALSAGQKAAAVNLGIFPEAGASVSYAFAAPSTPAPAAAPPMLAQNFSGDRLAGIDALLRGAVPAVQPIEQQVQPQPASLTVGSPRASSAASLAARKIWLQLASGANGNALSGQFRRMRQENRDLFDGIKGYVAEGPDRARLVVGPFRGASDAAIFADDLHSVGIDAFRWTSSETDRIVPLASQ